MDVGIDKEKLLHYRQVASEFLSDPVKLRLATVATLVAVVIVGGYMPLSKQIHEAQKRLADERERNGQITDVEKLQKQADAYRGRVSQGADTNDWVQYILGGLGQFSVKLRNMESREPKRVGPYRTVTLDMEIEGTYPQLRAFVEWLEQSDRLLRVDSVRFERNSRSLLLKTVVLGLVPKNARVAG